MAATPVFAALMLFAGSAQAGGSSVAVAAELNGVGCSGGYAYVNIDVAVTAGSAAPATVTLSTGGDFATVAQITTWASYGKTKAAEGTVQVAVPMSTPAQVTVCASQPGANGNDSRNACTGVALPAFCDGGSGTDLL